MASARNGAPRASGWSVGAKTILVAAVAIAAVVVIWSVRFDSAAAAGSGDTRATKTTDSKQLFTGVNALEEQWPGYYVKSCTMKAGKRQAIAIEMCPPGGRGCPPSKCSRAHYEAARVDACLRTSVWETPAPVRLRAFSLYRTVGNWYLAAYPEAKDLVSKQLSESGAWESDDMELMRRALLRLRQDVRSVANMLLRGYGVDPGVIDTLRIDPKDDGVEFVDVGVNVGAMAIPIWMSGFPVRGFEAMPANVQLIRMSRCLNMNAAQAPFVLTPGPLASLTQHGTECKIISSDTNIGDGVIVCGEPFDTNIYVPRANLTLRALDSVVEGTNNADLSAADSSGDPLGGSALFRLVKQLTTDRRREKVTYQPATLPNSMTWADFSSSAPDSDELLSFLHSRHRVMKIDVEGQELNVVKGAHRFLGGVGSPHFILCEVWPSLDGVALSKWMRRYRYRMKVPYTNGTWVWMESDDDVRSWQAQQKILVNVHFVRRGAEVLAI